MRDGGTKEGGRQRRVWPVVSIIHSATTSVAVARRECWRRILCSLQPRNCLNRLQNEAICIIYTPSLCLCVFFLSFVLLLPSLSLLCVRFSSLVSSSSRRRLPARVCSSLGPHVCCVRGGAAQRRRVEQWQRQPQTTTTTSRATSNTDTGEPTCRAATRVRPPTPTEQTQRGREKESNHCSHCRYTPSTRDSHR